MRQGTPVTDLAEVELVSLGRVAGAIEMRLKTCRVSAQCPRCGTSTKKVHSRYVRRLADLPWHGVPVVVRLQTRRFFCVGPGCQRKVFTEPLPGTVARYGRRSCRSGEALRCLTLALGGRAGARLAESLGLLASRSTLLRRLHHRRPGLLVQAPRVLGIDDCRNSVFGSPKRRAECVPKGFEDVAVVRRDRGSDQRVVAAYGVLHRRTVALPASRTAFDIREGERDRPGRASRGRRSRT